MTTISLQLIIIIFLVFLKEGIKGRPKKKKEKYKKIKEEEKEFFYLIFFSCGIFYFLLMED
jgi:hypothetical protein